MQPTALLPHPVKRVLRPLYRAIRPLPQDVRKLELREQQWAAAREYLAERGELAARFPIEHAQEHHQLMGDRAIEADSRSTALLRVRYVRTVEFASAHVPGLAAPEARVFDVGAANGLYLRAFGKDGVALNVDEQAVSAMRADGIEAALGSIYALPFAAKEFDYALCLEVLEHLENPIGALHELRRVAREAVLVSIPYVEHTRIRPFGYWRGDGDSARPEELRAEAPYHHVFEFTMPDFERVVGHAGWRVAVKEPLVPFAPMPQWWLAVLVPVWDDTA